MYTAVPTPKLTRCIHKNNSPAPTHDGSPHRPAWVEQHHLTEHPLHHLVGCGIALNLYMMGGGCVSHHVWPLTPSSAFVGGQRRAWQLMRQNTPVSLCNRLGERKDDSSAKDTQLWGDGVVPPKQVVSHVCGCGGFFVNVLSAFWCSDIYGLFVCEIPVASLQLVKEGGP